MADNDFDKTESPTPHRRQEARQDGNVAKSHDLTAACALLAAVVLLHVLGFNLIQSLRATVETMLTGAHAANPTRPADLMAMTSYAGWQIVYALGPLILAITAVALLVTLGQVGLLLTPKPLTPRFSRLSPLSGVKRLFDVRAGMKLVMNLLKIGVIAAVAVAVVANEVPSIIKLAELAVLPAFAAGSGIVYSLALKLAGLLLALAILDYTFERWKHERDLRMTKQEVKEELKRMDGDPLVKQRRSRVARQLALQRIAHAVPQADVVVTNPTHYAVALRYDSAGMTAPKVVAKGADFMAMRIRQIALANGVPLVERKALAQALYRGVEVGREIPPEFYGAVAEILAYVYRLSGRRSA